MAAIDIDMSKRIECRELFKAALKGYNVVDALNSKEDDDTDNSKEDEYTVDSKEDDDADK